MNSRYETESFGVQPFTFEFEEEFEQDEFEQDEGELGRGRGRRVPARRPAATQRRTAPRRATAKQKAPARKRPRPPFKPKPFPPRPIIYPVWPAWPVLQSEPPREPGRDSSSSGNAAPPSNDEPRQGSEHMRWVQTSLNQILNLQLPVDGVAGVETRSAIRSFQKRENLPVTGIVGPDTEQALLKATRGATDKAPTNDAPLASEPNSDAPPEQEFSWIASALPGLFTTPIEDRTAFTPKDLRKGKPRDINKVYALVLHQTAFSRGNDTTKYDRIPVHFVITPNGKIIQLHPLTALLWSSNGFNTGSVAVEFVGNFRSIEGRYYKPEKYGCHTVTPEQIKAGRDLIKHLRKQMPLTHILAHRQSSGNRTNDPGPEVWFNVGQWAIDSFGLKDGGPGFFIHSGKPIPEQWRKWGQVAASYPIAATSHKQCRLYRGK
jgi:hypothetical protein